MKSNTVNLIALHAYLTYVGISGLIDVMEHEGISSLSIDELKEIRDSNYSRCISEFNKDV